ncbi:uncharacterized protein LOC102677414 isoform X3 [Apis dorsata]|uniref:uncharacterized protein LOC102677414 isoform X3 n=1 Tax=Apis dorsata TaxID=7462 RepID=UPI0003DF5A75|nr:uncharacterized protein LOC102677414 isoform X3 [Apis dorsata]
MGTEKRAENIAFTANKHQYKKNFKKGNVKPGVCHYCHKPGHWIKERRNRKTANKKYKGRKEEALIGTMSAEYNLETSNDAWHMDSGATEHMLNRCEWFSSYKKFDTVENSKIGDGKYIQAIGSGDIDILAFNGKEWVRNS